MNKKEDCIFVEVFLKHKPCCPHRSNWITAGHLNDVAEYSKRSFPGSSLYGYPNARLNPYYELGYVKYTIHACKICGEAVAYQYRKPSA